MQIQKAIEIFLQKNNLTKTLQTFKSESKRTTVLATHSNPSKLSHAHLNSIHKFTLNRSNANQVRQHFQKTNPKVLKRAIQKMKKNPNLSKSQDFDLDKLTNLSFFQKLVNKQNCNIINQQQEDQVSQIRQSRIFNPLLQESRQYENEWENSEDIGYDVYQCKYQQLAHVCQQIARAKEYEKNAVKRVQFPFQYYKKYEQKITKMHLNAKDKKSSRLPAKVTFKKQQGQTIYPLESDGITYDSYDLKIVYDRQKTGLEHERDLKIVMNEVLAGRYQVIANLGQAQFSNAIQVKDLINNKHYCIKIIQNKKDYFDQSIDQIKLLRYISANCETDQSNLLTYHDYFYHREHLMIVTQLLKDNLYDAYRMRPQHFNLKAVQNYSGQILTALDKLHSLHIIHTDLKPENILIKSYSKQELKVIDLGSSIFFHDKQSFYVQTRSYRAPEVILGCPYDHKIDVWSFACIIAQIYTGKVLFESETVAGLLAKMQGLRGPWPSWMLESGKQIHKHFSKEKVLFEEKDSNNDSQWNQNQNTQNTTYRVYIPKNTNLKTRLNCDNKLFIDFLSKCLKLDPTVRLSVKQALKHPFLTQSIN